MQQVKIISHHHQNFSVQLFVYLAVQYWSGVATPLRRVWGNAYMSHVYTRLVLMSVNHAASRNEECIAN